MKALDIDVDRREELASDWSLGRQELGIVQSRGEAKRQRAANERRARRKSCLATTLPDSVYRCGRCNRGCHFPVGLYSYNRRRNIGCHSPVGLYSYKRRCNRGCHFPVGLAVTTGAATEVVTS